MQRSRDVSVDADEQRLVQIVRRTPWLMQALHMARELDLPGWCIGAGAVRNAVWDALHEYRTPSPLRDVDLAYFDLADLSAERDEGVQAQLRAREPSFPCPKPRPVSPSAWTPA